MRAMRVPIFEEAEIEEGFFDWASRPEIAGDFREDNSGRSAQNDRRRGATKK